jgi:hypothetical protein
MKESIVEQSMTVVIFKKALFWTVSVGFAHLTPKQQFVERRHGCLTCLLCHRVAVPSICRQLQEAMFSDMMLVA